MDSTIRTLEAAAVRAFNAGDRWHAFVQENRESIRKAEKAPPGTVQKLLHLLTTGEPSGMEPPLVGEAWGCEEQHDGALE